MNLKNTNNEYAQQLGALFEECPKAVLAAIAVSALTSGGDHLKEAATRLAYEWEVLHANGIVPQKLSKSARELARLHHAAAQLKGA